jgi:hypothetical protein
MRVLVGLLIVVHGVMGWPGFAVPWALLSSTVAPYTTVLAFGVLDVGGTGIRVFGLLWMVSMVLFVVAGIAFALGARWSVPLIAGTAAFQLILSVLNVPMTWEGCVLNLAILVAIGLVATGRLPATSRATSAGRRR